MILLLLCGAVALFALYKLLNIAFKHHAYSHIPGPARNGFFSGNAKTLRGSIRRTGNFGEVLRELMVAHGDVFVYWRLTQPIVVVSDLDAVKEFTTNLKLFPKRNESTVAMIGPTRYMGFHSILTDKGGPIWERKKRLMDPAFKISRLQLHIPALFSIGENVADSLEQEQAEKGVVEFGDVIAPSTIHAISRAGFSVTDSGQLQELSQGQATIGGFFVSQFKLPILQRQRLADILGFGNPDLGKATVQVKNIREQGKQLVLKRLTDGTYGSFNDVLDSIIAANLNDAGDVEVENCLDDFITMYEAGNITTSTTLGFVIAELVRNPACLEKLHAEVDTIWSGREISRSSPNEEVVGALKDMPYLDAVLNETLRRHSPVVVSTRIRATPWEVQGYKIPAHSWVSVSSTVLHHHPQHWDSPHTFNPERFLSGGARADARLSGGARADARLSGGVVPFSFMPFLVGPRRCLGKNFAVLEMKIFLAIWLSRMTFETAEEDCSGEIKTQQSLLLRMCRNTVTVRER